MKFKFLFTSLFLMLMSLVTFAQGEKEPYVIIENGTATFYYNDSKPSYSALELQTFKSWSTKDRQSVIHVVFDDSFKDYKPTSCADWFSYCGKLTEISGMKENLNTEDVTDMSFMFYECSNLTTIDLSNLNTANVTNMKYMFYGCSNLTTIDLSNFNTEKVVYMNGMFSGCLCLSTIFVDDTWTTSSVSESSDMFYNCHNLYGGKGSSPTNVNTGASFAKIDDGEENPGFFTKVGDPVFVPKGYAYAVLNDGTLTFYYDLKRDSREGKKYYGMNTHDWLDMRYESSRIVVRNIINKVIFDPSFVNYKPIDCSKWFMLCDHLHSIEGLEYLNTENVTDMSNMFAGCKYLVSIDVSTFNTENVTDMRSMFNECSFLKSIDLTSFNTEKVKDMAYMFYECSSLRTLDLSSFSTNKLNGISGMFSGCGNLRTIYVNDHWSFSREDGAHCTDVFQGCQSLYGGKGSSPKNYCKYSSDDMYACIDGGSKNPGFFTKIGDPAYIKIKSIQVNNKANYVYGEEFSIINGSLTITYTSGDVEVVNLSEATISGYDKYKLGEQKVKIVYDGFETTFTTPVSSTPDIQSDIKVWSSNSTIFIESAPDTKYTIIDLNGRTIKSATTKSTREQIKINKSGLGVVIINGESHTISL